MLPEEKVSELKLEASTRSSRAVAHAFADAGIATSGWASVGLFGAKAILAPLLAAVVYVIKIVLDFRDARSVICLAETMVKANPSNPIRVQTQTSYLSFGPVPPDEPPSTI